MLVKKGQNIKIINLHDKTVIYASRFVYIHQDLYIYIKIRIYTSRFVYIHQDLYIYIKICIYTSRFVYIQQDSYIYFKICIYTLRFVQFGHKGKHDRWIDYRVFKRRPKNGSNFSLLGCVYRAMTEEMTPASNVEEELLRVFPFFFSRVGAQQPPLCNPRAFVQLRLHSV